MKPVSFVAPASLLFQLCVGASPSAAQRKSPPSVRRTASNLFAYPIGALRANRVYCIFGNAGQLCSDVGESIYGGGAWPMPSPGNYIFSSGLQVAGIIPTTAGGGKPTFPWAGDTTGAYFYDARGTQSHGDPRTPVYNSRDTADAAAWPNGGLVRDGSVFDAMYLGRPAVSEQDLWTRYWDGNPALLSGRTHPMGIVIDQRVMGWRHPEANQDIIYLAFTLYNVTARTASAYANPTIPPGVQGEIAALGAAFQDSNEARLGVAIPDGGYALDSVYMGLGMDPDIGDASKNYATAILPFGTAMAYKSDFTETFLTYLPEVFGAPPFTPAPGFVATVFPRRPADIAIFTTFTGAPVGHADPVGVGQLWRYLSGVVAPSYGDSPCSTPVPRERHFCYLYQTQSDTRMELSLGPFSLAPGEATTIVAAYLFGAPLDTVTAYAGTPIAPGVPFTGDSIAADTTKLRVIDRAAGWLTQRDVNANGVIEMNEVTTARRSLLHKAQVAQAFVDHKFLTPVAPDAPGFFLIPGDKGVTVVWQPSPSEAAGDPYFLVASDPTSALYDPNYRRFDVEGYRIYRGLDPNSLELIAQVDHDTTQFIDYVGAVPYFGERCAPELGITDGCPVPFSTVPDSAVHNDIPIVGSIVQASEGGRILSSNGLVNTVRADTFPSGGASGFPALYDSGVTYVFTDSTVHNSFRYYYAVTAFDFNSFRSGPSSLESPRYVKFVTPRVPSGQERAGAVQPMRLLGGDGTALDTAAPLPTIDAATGIFSGPMPPADGFAVTPEMFPAQLLQDGSFTVTVDSVVPGAALTNRPAIYHLHVGGAGVIHAVTVPVVTDGFSQEFDTVIRFPAVALSDSQARRFGGDSTYALTARAAIRVPGTWRTTSWGRGDLNGAPPSSAQNGPRWWTGAPNENTAGPNELVCTPASGGCVQPNLTRNAGTLVGVDTLFHIQAYSTVPNTPMRDLEGIGATVYRAADMRVYWGMNGAIDSVADVTHRVRVPYSPKLRASWGILNDSSFVLGATAQAQTADGNNGLLTWSDIFCVDPVPTYLTQCGGGAQSPAVLQNHARLSAVSARSATYAGTASLPATGAGFIFYINGHFFLMQAASLPPAGTVWNVRFYAGTVIGTAAQANYAFRSAIRPPAAPGLRAEVVYQGSRFTPLVTNDSVLARVHTVPDPYYVANGYELAPDTLGIKFVHVPARALIRIYSVSGILVAVLVHNDPGGGGEVAWDLHSRTGRRVASGVYFYHIETPDGHNRVGRFTVVTGRRP